MEYFHVYWTKYSPSFDFEENMVVIREIYEEQGLQYAIEHFDVYWTKFKCKEYSWTKEKFHVQHPDFEENMVVIGEKYGEQGLQYAMEHFDVYWCTILV